MDAGLLFFSLLSLAINSVRWRVYDPHPQAGPAPAPITTTTPLAEIVLPFDRQVEVPAEDAWVWYLGMPLLGLLFLAFAWLCTAPDDESDLTAAAPSVAAASSPTKHASCQTLAWQGVDAGVQCNMDDAPVPAAVPAAPLSPISTVSMLPSAPVLSLSQIKTVFSFAPPARTASSSAPSSRPAAAPVPSCSLISSVSVGRPATTTDHHHNAGVYRHTSSTLVEPSVAVNPRLASAPSGPPVVATPSFDFNFSSGTTTATGPAIFQAGPDRWVGPRPVLPARRRRQPPAQ